MNFIDRIISKSECSAVVILLFFISFILFFRVKQKLLFNARYSHCWNVWSLTEMNENGWALIWKAKQSTAVKNRDPALPERRKTLNELCAPINVLTLLLFIRHTRAASHHISVYLRAKFSLNR